MLDITDHTEVGVLDENGDGLPGVGAVQRALVVHQLSHELTVARLRFQVLDAPFPQRVVSASPIWRARGPRARGRGR